MSNAILSQVDRQNVGQALRQARHTYRADRAMLTAVNKAALNLEACRWQWDGVTLAIESATEVGTVTHRLSERSACTCQAGQKGRVCWAFAALQLLAIAGDLAARVRHPLQSQAEYDAMVAALNGDLF
jgi:hypothetical protein